MRAHEPAEFPPEVEQVYRKAVRLEWITVAYIASAATLLYLTMGSSQAMRTSFYEDVISVVPALAFLVGTRVARRSASPDFPYGHHRATSIAHLAAALALCLMGGWLLTEAAMSYFSGERATIGGFNLFGNMVWAGWPMLAALVYTAVPSVILGRMKLKLAPKMHDKVLFADARMMKADWMAESATAVGVVGTGFGLWWLDPLAAALVSADILKDGIGTLKTAVADLIDRRPERADESGFEQLPHEVERMLRGLDWVEDARVRMRDEGHIFIGEAFVMTAPDVADLPAKLEDASARAKAMNWRVHELVVMPVTRLPDA
ncbi:cation diffusion facilitator family transporter [Sphingomonas lenta]|uniref:Cation transporter n=1 Tax=Sphingomonas lenta TaxID=1141887 RepID=A0A2A2SDD9_9SPHN|nr:cation transporter [Sphingomonas lenta]PAX07031.1 cation transporter [Sphingomonas lenta]